MAEDPFAGIEAQVGAGSLGGIDYQPSGLDSEPLATDPRPAGPHTGGVKDITDIQVGSLGGDGGEDEGEIGLSEDEQAHLDQVMAETMPSFDDEEDPTSGSPDGSSDPTPTSIEPPPPTSEPTPASSSPPSSSSSSTQSAGTGGPSGSKQTAEEPAPPAEDGVAKNAPRVYLILEQGVLETDEPYWFKVGEVHARTHDQALKMYTKENNIGWNAGDRWVVVNKRDFRLFAPQQATSLRLGEVT